MSRPNVRHLIVVGLTLAGVAACRQDPAQPAAIEDRTRGAGQAASDAAKDAGARVGAAVETADVKTALSMDSAVDASAINVDTDHVKKVVILKGSVPTAAQRTRAEAIAKQEATGYRIDNQLVVRVP